MIRILIRPIYDGQIITMSVGWMDSVTCKRPIHNLQSAIVHSFGHRQQTFSHPFLNVLIVPGSNTAEESTSRSTNMLECMFYVKQSWNPSLVWNFFSLTWHRFSEKMSINVQKSWLGLFGLLITWHGWQTSYCTHCWCSLVLLWIWTEKPWNYNNFDHEMHRMQPEQCGNEYLWCMKYL